MQATRFWVLTHCVLLLGSGALPCCGKDEGTGQHSSPGSAGGGADEPLGGGPDTPSAGTGASGTVSGGTHAGGTASGGTHAGGTVSGGGTGGTGASSSGNGGVADAPGGAADSGAPPFGSGGAGPVPGEMLTLCDRLTQRSTHAFNLARSYDRAVYNDCRTRWVTNLYVGHIPRETFLNDLQSWNLAFWGCSDTRVENFALVYGPGELSAGDAAAVIEDYMTVATAELSLSPTEADEMHAALDRLSQQDIVDPSLELTGSLCETAQSRVGAGDAAGGTL